MPRQKSTKPVSADTAPAEPSTPPTSEVVPAAVPKPAVEQPAPEPEKTATPVVAQPPIAPVAAPKAASMGTRPVSSTTQKEPQPEAPTLGMKKSKKDSALTSMIASLGFIGLGKERMAFVQNLATLLNAGLPLVESIRTLKEETRTKPMKKMMGRILEAVESGSPLWSAMDEQHFFTPYAISLIRIGEEAGSLSQNMQYLAEQQEKDSALKSKVKMAMIYPTIVIVLIVIMVLVLGIFVLPNLVQVLFALNTELPLATRVLIVVANFFSQNGTLSVLATIFSFVGIFVLVKLVTPVRRAEQWLMFKIPGIGSLARQATIARFGVILGGLLRAGVPMVDALKSLVEVTPVLAYRDLYAKLLENVSLGQSFQKSFADIKASRRLLPVSVQSLVVVGEKSGSLADVLMKIADIYDRKASDTAQKLPIVLEPMLLIFIGGLVGFIAFAILMPIYSVVGNLS